MGKGKITKLITENKVDAWDLTDNILWEVYILQKVQNVYFNDVSALSFAEEEKEDTAQRLIVLEIVGNEILERMEEIQEGLEALINLISALQKTGK